MILEIFATAPRRVRQLDRDRVRHVLRHSARDSAAPGDRGPRAAALPDLHCAPAPCHQGG